MVKFKVEPTTAYSRCAYVDKRCVAKIHTKPGYVYVNTYELGGGYVVPKETHNFKTIEEACAFVADLLIRDYA